jgi:hypothetical protein
LDLEEQWIVLVAPWSKTIRWRWFPGTTVRSSIAQVTLAGIVVFAVGIVFGGA